MVEGRKVLHRNRWEHDSRRLGSSIIDMAASLKANAGLPLFITSGPLLTLVNKAILDTGFRQPVIVSGFGMFATMLFTQLLALGGYLDLPERPAGFWLKQCLPVGVAAMSTMGFGNAACALLRLPDGWISAFVRLAFSRSRVSARCCHSRTPFDP